MSKVAVIVPRVGPYHAARLDAASSKGELVCVQLSDEDVTYRWSRVKAGSFSSVSLFSKVPAEEICYTDIRRVLFRCLNSYAPSCVAITGWSDPAMLAGLQWAERHKRPAVLFSESQFIDARRNVLGERVKSWVVRKCSSALVGGERHRSYLANLGMNPKWIWLGYDVVDNEHFHEMAWETRRRELFWRKELGLPNRFVLCCARFVPKKNLEGLVREFACAFGCSSNKELLILGSGALRERIWSVARDCGVADRVRMPGFVQYQVLPRYYGLADFFVLPSMREQWGLVVNEAMACGLPVLVSSRCGCSDELVRHGENGYLFDPHGAGQLAKWMLKLGADSDVRRRFGEASRSIISNWSPERFAEGFWSAVGGAKRNMPRSHGLVGSMAISGLCMRSRGSS